MFCYPYYLWRLFSPIVRVILAVSVLFLLVFVNIIIACYLRLLYVYYALAPREKNKKSAAIGMPRVPKISRSKERI